MIDPQSVFKNIKKEAHKVIIGNNDLIEQVIIAFFCGGHVLLEGVPGLGKTLLVKTISQILNIKFNRIQFTPDLMPADIIGTTVIHQLQSGERVFRFQKGPLFAHLVLADEINRATAKTQSALLEAMGEGSISVAGKSHYLEQPFFVMGTQNPLEMDGTYKLPEAQLDRFFFKIDLPFPDLKTLMKIVDTTTQNTKVELYPVVDIPSILEIRKNIRDVPVASHLNELACKLVLATQPRGDGASAQSKKYVSFGVGPRGLQSLILAAKAYAYFHGRLNVSKQDIMQMVPPTFRHRMALNFEGEAEGLTTDTLLEKITSQLERL
ncbi:MAG: AAA family ATPase [Candidatus Cloacimonadota bacterium]|nr:MAG: AAA family ATPase [Candidatus Cloacimonadota bacterium]